jgi:hypothetical protein
MTLHQTPLRLSLVTAKYVLRAMLCLPVALITASDAKEGPKSATVSLAEKVADGRPWTMNVAEYSLTMKMALFPDGSGVTDGVLAPTPKWRPTADGLCLKPSMLMSEHCLTLVPRPNGYDGVENGELYFELRR